MKSGMRAVGIKQLKTHLSRYIDFVRKGEIVLVTDRDEIVAEIRIPSQPTLDKTSRWFYALQEEARQGSIHLAKRKHTILTGPPSLSQSIENNLQSILNQTRTDRY
ncbi:MAG: hypothetical protein JW841_18570 [Deltaproteobacteria bacterium]|nr:hypothetical protein [Deltaproteobacteria bacterium]